VSLPLVLAITVAPEPAPEPAPVAAPEPVPSAGAKTPPEPAPKDPPTSDTPSAPAPAEASPSVAGPPTPATAPPDSEADTDAAATPSANPDDPPEATEEAAPAKLGKPAPPPRSKQGAMGTGGQTPLPAAPAPEDPASIRATPWRGRFELDFQVGAGGPIGGRRPGVGTVVSAFGAVGFAARLHPMVALGVGATTYIHDSGQRTLVGVDGSDVVEQGLGRVTLFDVPALRVFWPAAKRIEPYGLVATSLGIRREPLTGRGSFAVGVRAAGGVDFWLGSSFTLGAELGYRALFIERSAGHAMQGGLRFALHW